MPSRVTKEYVLGMLAGGREEPERSKAGECADREWDVADEKKLEPNLWMSQGTGNQDGRSMDLADSAEAGGSCRANTGKGCNGQEKTVLVCWDRGLSRVSRRPRYRRFGYRRDSLGC